MPPAVTGLLLTEYEIGEYFKRKLAAGVSAATIVKYKTPLHQLYHWLGESKEVSAARLQEWRASLVAHGYGKITVQNYVTVANDFLRTVGCAELCIPKPLQNDLAGKTFGYLTVLEPTQKRKRKDIIWRCKCKCGKEAEIPTVMLLGGHTTSCGCLNAEILRYVNRFVEGTSLRQCMDDRVINPNSASGYVGVYPKRDKWTAYINYKGVRYNLGTYRQIEDAVKARARGKEWVMEEAAKLYEVYADCYGEKPRRPEPPVKTQSLELSSLKNTAKRSDNTSGQTGVTRQKGKWNASICVRGRRYKLGAYHALEDAVAARKRAEELVKVGDIETLKAISTNG